MLGSSGKKVKQSVKATVPKVVYRQACKSCNLFCFPYENEAIVCSICGTTDCQCLEEDGEAKVRKVNPEKRHPSELCEKCLRGHPCDSEEVDNEY